MQINSLYLYPNRLDVYTSDTAVWAPETFRMVYNRNLKIYRSVDNRIDVQIHNRDQKAYNATGTHIVINLVNMENKDLILQKDCDVDDLAVGRVYATLTETELQNLEPGFYTYSFHKETRQNLDSTQYKVLSKTPIYMDNQYGALGQLEVYGDMEGSPYDTITVDTFSKTVVWDDASVTPEQSIGGYSLLPRPNFKQSSVTVQDYDQFFTSSIIDAQGNRNTPNSLHTFQFYYTNFIGDLILQGSVGVGGKPSEGSFDDLHTFNITTANSNEYYNLIGKYNWFRIVFIPDTTNTGTVDKVLYR